MMPIFWFLLGSSLAILHLTSQWWAVQQLQPAQANQALVLIFGGAIIRWLLAAILFLLALPYGLWSLGFVVAGMWITRWAGVCWFGCRSSL